MRSVQWSWLRGALRIGLATSAPVIAGVILGWLVPALFFGYPLVLLSLLLVGPLAATRRHPLATALVAGCVSAIVACASMAFGLIVLDTYVWSLNAQLSMTPMPSWIPRATLLPTQLLTWGQQDVLFGQPALAVVLAGIGLLVRRLGHRVPRLLPKSLNARLQLTVGALTALTLLVGWVGFSALEDMHFRGHRVQLYVRWQSLLSDAHAALDDAALAHATGRDPSPSAETLETSLRLLATTTTYPGIAVDDETIEGLLERYVPLLDGSRDAAAAYHAHPSEATRHLANASLNALDAQLDNDTLDMVDADDASHHANLLLVMLAVGLGAGLGLWVGQRSVASVTEPISQLGLHLAGVARGEFGSRVDPSGPQELQRLAHDVNSMTADLDRLYAMERTMFQEQLRHQSLHDALTGLPNRTLLLDRLEHAIARADSRERLLGVLMVDLDNFKVINDSLGHESGDRLLETIAQRLRAAIRAGDTVARVGGDVFTLLIEEVSTLDEVKAVAENVIRAIAQPIDLRNKEVFVTASVGIAHGAGADVTPETLLRGADLALHQAKAGGKARFEVYDASLETRAVERLETEIDLRRALERGEFTLDYQPIVDLGSGEIVEVEALVRWNHPERGRIAPAAFIPIAEETGLIVPLGQWVLETACAQAHDWHTRYTSRTPLVMSVNLSGRQFQHPSLAVDIEHAVRHSRLDARYLKLEITESVLMRNIDTAVSTLHALKALDIQLAIDDFGTGYSSLSYLKQFPVDTLKIDRSFVNGLGTDAQDTAIVRSVVGLAKTLHMSVTGEGIETPAQQAQLARLGCDRGQGFLIARPAAAAAVDDMLRTSPGLAA
jgi:diguanylate cyclase (GGDEF)-like protein